MNVSLRNCRAVIAIGLLLTFSGCNSLDDVAGLGKLADQLRTTLPPVTADIAATCVRQNNLLADIPEKERGSIAPDDCAPFTDLADHLTQDQNVLIAYLEALGKLASNTPLSYDKTISTNVATIAAYQGLSTQASAAATAAQKLSGILADAATHAYRERKVNEIIVTADPAVQELTAALKQAITVEYALILTNEGQHLDSFYQGPMAAQQNERLSLILVQRQYDGDKTALASHVAAATAYGKVMDDLAKTHAKLAAAAAKHSSLTDLAKDLGPNVSALKDSVSTLAAQEK